MIVPVMVPIMVIAIVVTIPVAIGMPTLLLAIPPSVIPVPAAFPLRVQVSSLLVGLMAALAVFANRLVQPGFRALHFFLALPVVVRVGVRPRHAHQHRPT